MAKNGAGTTSDFWEVVYEEVQVIRLHNKESRILLCMRHNLWLVYHRRVVTLCRFGLRNGFPHVRPSAATNLAPSAKRPAAYPARRQRLGCVPQRKAPPRVVAQRLPLTRESDMSFWPLGRFQSVLAGITHHRRIGRITNPSATSLLCAIALPGNLS